MAWIISGYGQVRGQQPCSSKTVSHASSSCSSNTVSHAASSCSSNTVSHAAAAAAAVKTYLTYLHADVFKKL